MLLAIFITLASSIWSVMNLSYQYGGINLHGFWFIFVPRAAFNYIAPKFADPTLANLPGWGFTAMEMLDADGDGALDVLLSNGDTTEFRSNPRAYHGIRIYDLGADDLAEKQFIPAHGVMDFTVLDAEADARAGDPGPVTLRRLSNTEYDNAVRDLTGVGKSWQKEPPEMVEQDVLVVMRDERAPARRVDADNDPHIFEP